MKKDGIVLTTDDFFIAENGQYKFDVAKLGRHTNLIRKEVSKVTNY